MFSLEMSLKIRKKLLDHTFELIDAQAEIEHIGFVHITHSEILHNRNKNGKRFFFRHLSDNARTICLRSTERSFTYIHQEKTNNETDALTIAHFTIE